MTRMLRYESGIGSEAVELDGRSIYSGTAAGLRGREWDYSLGYRGISQVSRGARAVEVDLAALDKSELDRLRRVMDRDVANLTPGKLVYRDEWETSCYGVGFTVDTVSRGSVTGTLALVLTDPVWRRGHTVRFRPVVGESDYLDYPYDYPYDLKRPSNVSEVEAGEWVPSPVRITVYGYASSPYVIVGGNRYQVDVTVPSNGYLVIDGLAKTVEVTDSQGNVSSAFAEAVRGTGEGSGEYVFQKVPAGVSAVSWNQGFLWDLTWYEEEGEPPWSS